MEETHLVQRLHKPHPVNPDTPLGKLGNPFSFGGGLKNGGLTDEAMGLLREVFSFDYMGSSEFEWGAVPEALQALAKAKNRVAFTLQIERSQVKPPFRVKSDPKPNLEGDATVYVLCDARQDEQVADRIMAWARDGDPSTFKEASNFTRSLLPVDEWDSETAGWLELDNGFLWFTDEAMWRKACDLFGVKT